MCRVWLLIIICGKLQFLKTKIWAKMPSDLFHELSTQQTRLWLPVFLTISSFKPVGSIRKSAIICVCRFCLRLWASDHVNFRQEKTAWIHTQTVQLDHRSASRCVSTGAAAGLQTWFRPSPPSRFTVVRQTHLWAPPALPAHRPSPELIRGVTLAVWLNPTPLPQLAPPAPVAGSGYISAAQNVKTRLLEQKQFGQTYIHYFSVVFKGARRADVNEISFFSFFF